ncbi:membrane protein YbhM [Escherichia coli]|uniref:Membrane protein YbhM n=1 Tax=Escherichia coli TaxID=562 RepID=A0A376MTY6_ECOLX|nr:membrane protein YbhM [Escherichia coli]
MESYSQNSNKLDFQHEARILNGIWLITALGMVATARLALVIIMNAALMSERPVWVISCLMMCYGQALSRMDEISSLNWRGNAIVKGCGVRFVALLQVH